MVSPFWSFLMHAAEWTLNQILFTWQVQLFAGIRAFSHSCHSYLTRHNFFWPGNRLFWMTWVKYFPHLVIDLLIICYFSVIFLELMLLFDVCFNLPVWIITLKSHKPNSRTSSILLFLDKDSPNAVGLICICIILTFKKIFKLLNRFLSVKNKKQGYLSHSYIFFFFGTMSFRSYSCALCCLIMLDPNTDKSIFFLRTWKNSTLFCF